MKGRAIRSPFTCLYGAVLICATVLAGASDSDREFSLPTEPDAVVLSYYAGGAFRPHDVSYTLYGDGRLVRAEVQLTTNKVVRSPEIQLERVAAEDLVRLVVDAGLMDCDSECIEGKVKACLGTGKVPRAQDGSEVFLTINLAAYRRSGSSKPRPKSSEIRLHSPDMLARYCPELPELAGLVDVGRALSQSQLTNREAPP